MLRIGVLTPSSNTVLEPETARLMAPLADRVSWHIARFPVTVIADEAASHAQFALEPMLAAVDLLADARMDAYLWSGTAAAWQGLDSDRRLVEAIEGRTGRPSTTSTLALLDAFGAFGVEHYALVVPYVATIAERIVANLGEQGYACTAVVRDDLTTNWDFAGVEADGIAHRVRRAAQPARDEAPDAIAVHCTNFRGAPIVSQLERELGIPVIDSVAVGLWGALGLLGVDVPNTGFGRLAGVRSHRAEPAVAHA